MNTCVAVVPFTTPVHTVVAPLLDTKSVRVESVISFNLMVTVVPQDSVGVCDWENVSEVI